MNDNKKIMDAFREWLLSEGRSNNTISSYLKVVNYFEEWFKKNIQSEFVLVDISPVDLRSWKNYLLNDAKKKNKEPLSIRTVNGYIEATKTFFRFLFQEKIILNNPAINLKPQNEKNKHNPKWLEKHEKKLLLRIIEDPSLLTKNAWKYYRNKLIIYLPLHAGLRISEILSLNIHDIKDGYINIRAGKGQAARNVPMNKSLLMALNEWLSEREKLNPDNEALFLSQKGGRLTVSGIYNLFENLKDKTRIKGLTPHSLRHTFAHDALEKGHPITYVAELLGHEDIETTRIYTSPKKKNLKDVVDSLSEE